MFSEIIMTAIAETMFLHSNPAILGIVDWLSSYSLQILLFITIVLLVFYIHLNRQISKKTKALIKATNEAEEANKAKSNFLTTMSHELRTPMNSIIGFSEIILTSNSLDEAHKNAGIILRESKLLMSLISDILDLSKIESGKVRIEHHKFDIRELFDLMAKSFQRRLKEKHLSYQVSVDKNVPQYLKGDPLRLLQVLSNLVSNAIKFTNEGRITLTCNISQKSDRATQIRFTVADTGIGIPQEKLNSIFESFRQLDEGSDRKYGGLGLGLCLASEILKLMGSRFEIKSDKNKGSEFSFTINFEIPEQTDTESTFVLPIEIDTDTKKFDKSIKKGHVLTVDDYIPNLILLKQIFKDAGFAVSTEKRGADAVKATQKTKFDLILMDIQMPEMDGIEATQLIRRDSKLNNKTPIIALTADAFESTRYKCLEAGLNDVVTKPFRHHTLFNTINKWLLQSELETLVIKPDEPQEIEPLDASPPTPEPDAPSSQDQELIPINYSLTIKEFKGKEKFVKTTLVHFLTTAKKQLGGIDENLNSDDFDSIRREAHKIKGAAGNLNAFPLAGAASNVEKAATERDKTALIELVSIMKAQYENLVTYYENKIKK